MKAQKSPYILQVLPALKMGVTLDSTDTDYKRKI